MLCSLIVFSATAGIAADEKQDDKPALPGLRQPGDANVFELKDESSKIDPTNTDALAQYMAGLLAQRRGDLPAAADAFQKAVETAPKSPAPLKALALVQLRLGRTADGMKSANKAIQLDPDDYETRLQLALLQAGLNEPVKATEMIDAALKSTTLKKESREFITIHQVRGRLLLAQQKLGPAADSYEVILQALERPEDFGLNFRDHQALLKDRASGYDVTGRILLEAGRTDSAIKAFEALSRLDSNRPGEHHLMLARAYFMKDQLADSEKNLDTYFMTGRRDAASLNLLQDLYRATSRSDALIERLTALTENATDAVPVRMFVGQTLVDQGKIDEAAAVYQKLLDEKGDVDAYLGLMRVEIARKNAEGLLTTMSRAIRARIQPQELMPLAANVAANEPFARELIQACEQTWKEKPNELNAAVTFFCASVARELKLVENEGTLLQATLESNPNRNMTVEVLDRYGANLLEQEKFAQAARVYRQMVSIPGLNEGQRLQSLYLLSQAESMDDNHTAAIEAIKTAIEMRSEIPLLHYQLGLLLFQADQLDDAEAQLKRTLTLFPNDAENVLKVQFMLAGVYSQQSQWQKAIDQYQVVLKVEGITDDITRRVKLGLSNAYVQNGDMPSGEKILEEVYELDPTEPGVNNDLGYLYADQGKNLEKAEKMIRIAVAAQPDNPAYLDSLGWVLFRLERFEEARTELIKACADPDYKDATILEHLGDVHQALKQPEEAKKAWQEALQIEQESERRDETIVKRITEKLGN